MPTYLKLQIARRSDIRAPTISGGPQRSNPPARFPSPVSFVPRKQLSSSVMQSAEVLLRRPAGTPS